MNVTGTRDDEIAHYIAAVEDSLSDLPPHVRGELIGDLVDHLTEIAGEITMAVPLAARLGPPEGYAAELRATLPTSADTGARMPRPTVHPPSAVDWQALADRLDHGAGRIFGYPRATDLLRALRPGWWVARALVLSVGIVWLFMGNDYYLVDVESQNGPALLLVAALTPVAAVASIRLGRGTSLSARVTGTVLNLFVAPVLALGMLAGISFMLPIY